MDIMKFILIHVPISLNHKTGSTLAIFQIAKMQLKKPRKIILINLLMAASGVAINATKDNLFIG